MRKSNYDKYVCVACLLVTIYSFFVVGFTPVYESDLSYPEKPAWWRDDGYDKVVYVEYPVAVLIAPLAFLLFLFLMVFDDELLVVDRYWFTDGIRSGVKAFKKKLRRGMDEYQAFNNKD